MQYTQKGHRLPPTPNTRSCDSAHLSNGGICEDLGCLPIYVAIQGSRRLVSEITALTFLLLL